MGLVPTAPETDDDGGFTLDPSLLAERRAATARRTNTVQVPAVRTVGFVISPFVKRGRVDSIYYNQTSMIRTIEELLGMPPMNKFDAAALPMRSIFTNEPDFRPFGSMPNQTPLNNLNPSPDRLETSEKAAALESMAMDFTHPDAAPEDRLNRILWHVAKGWSVPYPVIPHRWGCRPDGDH